MFKILSSIALSATVFTVGMAPALASSKVESLTVPQDSSNSIEIEGRILADVEAAKVEGEALPLFILPVLLKVAAASATKAAVIGVGKGAVSATLVGGKFIIKSAGGAILGQIAVERAQNAGWLRR